MQHGGHVHLMKSPCDQSNRIGFVVVSLKQFDLFPATELNQLAYHGKVADAMVFDQRQRTLLLLSARSQGLLDHWIWWAQVNNMRVVPMLADEPR